MCLSEIQSTLNAPKNLHNKFGGYNYRSCESILEALKPLLKQHNASLILNDDMVEVGGRIYVKATVTLTAKDQSWQSTAFARESETKKGMDESQITGAASSYARKYALNGLFAIDDTKDADATNKHDTSTISDKQASTIRDMIASVGADEEAFCKFLKVPDVFNIPASRYESALSALKQKGVKHGSQS